MATQIIYTSNEKRNLVTFATTSVFLGHPPPTMKADGPSKLLTLEFCTLVLELQVEESERVQNGIVESAL